MYNKVIMIGRLTSTPELHKTNNDKSVARATIAINRRFKDKMGNVKLTSLTLLYGANLLKPWLAMRLKAVSFLSMGSFVPVSSRRMVRPTM